MKQYQFDFDFFAKKFDELITVKDEKSISYSEIFLMPELEAILQTAFHFSPITPQATYPIIINDAIHNFVRKKKKDGYALKSSLKYCENKYLDKEMVKYQLLTSLSFSYFDQLPRLNLAGTNVQFFPQLPPKYKIFENIGIKYKFSDYPPRDYVIVRVTLRARSMAEAIDLGLAKVNFIRGFWNFSINYRLGATIQSGVKDPINQIRLGPLHTLHHDNGKLASDHFWMENNYIDKSCHYKIKNSWNDIYSDFVHFRKCIKKSKSNINFEDIINFYSNSLDSNNFESVFIKLWTLLEQLTDTRNSSYDKTIKRTLRFYRGDRFVKETLEHLRIVRNNFVHKGESRDEIDPLLFQLKKIVERLIVFHINNLNNFSDFEEVGQFLDLSLDESSLKREIHFRNRTLNELKKKRV